MRRHKLKALGLAVMAVLGLVAVTASQALGAELNVIMEPATSIPGIFLINNGTEAPKGSTQETIAASGPGGRLIIPAKSAEIDCTAESLTGSPTPFIENEYKDWSLAIPGPKVGGHGAAEATMTGCKVFNTSAEGVKGAEIAACTAVVKSEGRAVGTITVKGLLRVVRHPEGEVKKAFVVLEPEVTSAATSKENTELKSKFTKLVFGGTCSLPATVDLHGAIVIKAPTADAPEPELSVKSWEVSGGKAVLSAEQKLLGAALTFDKFPAFIEANNTNAKLTGTSSASWGVM